MNRSILQAYAAIAMDRQATPFSKPGMLALTEFSGAVAIFLIALSATSYRFVWSLGSNGNDDSMPTPSWGCAVADGYVFIIRITEKLDFNVGEEGTFVMSVPPDIERSFHHLVGSTFSKQFWVTGNIFDPEARHEFHHQTVWASLWLLGAACAILALACWSKIRKGQGSGGRRERCASCHYWLIGNESGICPECGGIIPEAQRIALELAGAKTRPTDTLPWAWESPEGRA